MRAASMTIGLALLPVFKQAVVAFADCQKAMRQLAETLGRDDG
jgi:hypothetical protein